jgi:hypothetical protein
MIVVQDITIRWTYCLDQCSPLHHQAQRELGIASWQQLLLLALLRLALCSLLLLLLLLPPPDVDDCAQLQAALGQLVWQEVYQQAAGSGRQHTARALFAIDVR